MRILINECVDPRVKILLSGHEPATVHEKGWDAYADGPLLTAAQDEFDMLFTIDGKLEHQQNLKKYRIAVVVAHVHKNQFAYYRALQPEILAAIASIQGSEVIHVGRKG